MERGASLKLKPEVLALPGTREIAVAKDWPFAYGLSVRDRAAVAIQIDLESPDRATRTLPLLFTHRAHHLGVLFDGARAWLFGADPISAADHYDDSLLVWELDVRTGLPTSRQPLVQSALQGQVERFEVH